MPSIHFIYGYATKFKFYIYSFIISMLFLLSCDIHYRKYCMSDKECRNNGICRDGKCVYNELVGCKTETEDGSLECPVQNIGLDPGFDPSSSGVGVVPFPPGGLAPTSFLDITGFSVLSQGGCGSCVAFAVRSAMGIRNIYERGAFIDFSPAHIWNIAGYGGVDCLQGSRIKDVVEDNIYNRIPVVPSSVWEYDPGSPEISLDSSPSEIILQETGIAFIGGAIGASPGNIDEIKSAIMQGWPVVVAVKAYSNLGWNSSGIIDLPSSEDPLRGWHAITIYGYEDVSQNFYFVNSWGRLWGNSGRGTLTYRYISSDNYSGGYAIKYLRNLTVICPDNPYCSEPSWQCFDEKTSIYCFENNEGCIEWQFYGCGEGSACKLEDGKCDCEPNCFGRLCGSDGCGGECGPGCDSDERCTSDGRCVFECNSSTFNCELAGGEGNYCIDGNRLVTCSFSEIDGCFDVVVESCDDGNSCTNDYCSGGICSNNSLSDGVPCDSDGNVCTSDICMYGTCTHYSSDIVQYCGTDSVCYFGTCKNCNSESLCSLGDLNDPCYNLYGCECECRGTNICSHGGCKGGINSLCSSDLDCAPTAGNQTLECLNGFCSISCALGCPGSAWSSCVFPYGVCHHQFCKIDIDCPAPSERCIDNLCWFDEYIN